MKLTPEQKARDLLERMGVDDAQGMSAGDVVEIANLFATIERLKLRLIKARKYVAAAGNEAEARHDNPSSESYGEYSEFEIMTEVADLLKEIDADLSAGG